jgi:HlyD family secretion protein
MAGFIILMLIAAVAFYMGRKKAHDLMQYAGLGLFVLSLVLFVAKQMGWVGGQEGTVVQTTFSSRNDIVETVSASGKIQPEVEVKLSPDVSGEIVELAVKEGDQVIKGDLLVKIKPDTYLSMLQRSEASLNTSKANLAMSKAQLVESQAKFNRYKTLYENGAISASEYEQVESSFKVAKLNVESSEYAVNSATASLNEAVENLNKTSIYAPVDGTISKLNVELGERVVGTAQMAGTELLRLANLTQMEVAVEVNENDINRVSLGDTALIEVDAFLGKKYKGIVSEIANSADVMGTSADQVTNFEVKIRVVDQEAFRPGMTATVEVQTTYEYNVLTVPIQAVTTRKDTAASDEKLECVFVLEGGKVKQQYVSTGVQDDEFIHVLTGLSDSVELVTGPYSAVSKLLKDGTRVTVENKED